MNSIWALLPLALLAKFAHDDLRHRRLANTLVVSYALLFVPVAWQMEFNAGMWGAHLLVAGLAFLALLGLFVLGVMGGGDVKLGSAILLWAGPQYALPVLALVAWIGGVLAVLGLLADRTSTSRLSVSWVSTIRQALSARRGVPYGVALAGGGVWLLWQYFSGAV